nr:DUF1419 domain-containing protein [Bradyrhizobium sp. Leo170]
MTLSPIRKVYQEIADRRQMFRMFDRHAQRPNRSENDDSVLYRGEWFEIGQADHDHMFEILPPLWMRADMFAMREFMTGGHKRLLLAFGRRPQAVLPWLLRSLGSRLAGAHEAGDHRA